MRSVVVDSGFSFNGSGPINRSRLAFNVEFQKTRPSTTDPGQPTVKSTKRFLQSTAAIKIEKVSDFLKNST